ncbi:MAG: response regulator [Treponema sp.]|jgi:signal transduction histidine kinase/CheY-like chemotaxis protein|nr:response regulator [Treponema sp.]
MNNHNSWSLKQVSQRNSSHTRYYKLANTLAFFSILVFGIFRGIEFLENGDYAALRLMLIFVLLSLILLILLFSIARSARVLAFFIPLFVFAIYSAGSILIGYFSHYFIVYLVLCIIAGVYFQPKSLFWYILVSNAAIFCIVISGVFFRENSGVSQTSELIASWVMAICGSMLVYTLTKFAWDKNSASVKAEDTFTTLMASTPNLMATVDELNCITYISKPLAEFAHIWNAELPVGRPILDLFGEMNIKMTISEILESPGYFEDTREITRNGKPRYFKIISDKLAGDTGGTFIDITDITPVVQSKLEAEAANRSKSSFLATMSHEIRTPLNAIIGFSEIELQRNLSAEARVNLEKIFISGSGLLAIINDILDISKIEAGSFSLIPVDYDSPSLINDTIQLNIVRIGSKPIEFELEIDETLPARLHGDEIRVRQILSNLLSNAFKYTEAGKVVLRIRWEVRGQDLMLIFIVEDTGRGIKKEDIGKLFSEYSQLDVQANRKIEGTGLGLSITKKLITMMDGSIEVESEYGRGSVFTARIRQGIVSPEPLGREMVENLKTFKFRESQRKRGTTIVRSWMPYGKVLIVDDVATNLDVARGLMLPYGLSIDCVSSGPAAVALIRKEQVRYDAVFMDHMMPGMDGIEAVRIIRNEIGTEYAKNIPIIALTANALAGNEKLFIANGFNDFISKPVDLKRLNSLLNHWIRDRQSKETLRKAEKEQAEKAAAHAAVEAAERALAESAGPGTGSWPKTGLAADEIDFSAGVDRYGEQEVYVAVLRSYMIHTPDLLEKLRSPSPETLGDYAVNVHGLKGASYGICAEEIGKTAEALEYAAKAGNYEKVAADNREFIDRVEKALAGIRALLQENGEVKKEQAAAPSRALLEKILDAGRHFKSTMMEAAVGELEKYTYESGGDLVAWLREQVDNLEYDAIRQRLEKELGGGT